MITASSAIGTSDEDDEQQREHVGPLRYAPSMSFVRRLPFPRWTIAIPPLASLVLALTWGHKPPGVVLALVGVFLAGAVLAAVHHAEVVAHRVGEPFGSLCSPSRSPSSRWR